MPVYELMGGPVRQRMPVYVWIGGDRASTAAQDAREKVAAGYKAVKMNGTEEMAFIDSYRKVDEAVARMVAIREAVGYEIGVGVDFHGRVHKTMANILIKELEPFRPMFIEEPVLPENNEALEEIKRVSRIPIATGERMYTRWGFKQLLASGNVDIIQPDLCHAGGIWEVRKIAAMAEAYDIAVAPHCPLGPIALAASLQLDFCTPNAFIQEQSLGIHYNQGTDMLDYLADPGVFGYAQGSVALPRAPGLGIEMNEAKIRAAAQQGHRWRNPVWRTEDGVVAEW